VSVRAEVGPAVEVIERVAAEENADLVVMSNLGKGAVTGRLLGSTAERLATAGKLPVLIERVREDAGAWCRIADSHPFGKVLIGADLTDSLQGQLGVVGNLPGLGEVRVVHVTDPGTDADLVTGELAAHASHRLPGVRVETALREGTDKAEELLAEAAEWGASVIVVSPRSHGILHRALWGSTARTVALQSPRAGALRAARRRSVRSRYAEFDSTGRRVLMSRSRLILLPTDGSPTADAASHFAESIARAEHSSILVMTIAEPAITAGIEDLDVTDVLAESSTTSPRGRRTACARSGYPQNLSR
jgi:nucleotide-binding universal stress UspA family protein